LATALVSATLLQMTYIDETLHSWSVPPEDLHVGERYHISREIISSARQMVSLGALTL